MRAKVMRETEDWVTTCDVCGAEVNPLRPGSSEGQCKMCGRDLCADHISNDALDETSAVWCCGCWEAGEDARKALREEAARHAGRYEGLHRRWRSRAKERASAGGYFFRG